MTLRSLVLLGLLASLLTGLGALAGPVVAAAALAGAIVVSFWSYWSALPDFLLRTRACDDPAITKAATDLAARAGLPPPPVYVIDDPQPNAFTLGSHPQRSGIILTSALCSKLAPQQIGAVLGHEIAHIRHRDVLAATLATTFVQAILSLAALFALIALLVDRRARPPVLAVALLSPLTALIIRCAHSRAAEYRADRDAAQFCGSPEPLISALRRLASLTQKRQGRIPDWDPALASLCFVDPLANTLLATLLSPHPTIKNRIEKLQSLKM